MIADLGWSRADYALLGTLSIVPTCAFLCGRLADLFGVKRTADRHHCAAAELSRLLADDRGGLAIHRHLPSRGHLGITTTNTVYSRVAVQYSETAWGWRLPSWRPGPPAPASILRRQQPYRSGGMATTYRAGALRRGGGHDHPDATSVLRNACGRRRVAKTARTGGLSLHLSHARLLDSAHRDVFVQPSADRSHEPAQDGSDG